MHESWKDFLESEFAKPYFQDLSKFLHDAYENSTVFPAKTQVFRAFTTDLNSVKSRYPRSGSLSYTRSSARTRLLGA